LPERGISLCVSFWTRSPLVVLSVAVAACSASVSNRPAQGGVAPGEPSVEASGPPRAGVVDGPSGPTATAPAASPRPSGSPAPAGSAATALEHHGAPLPELRVKSFGLHVGGAARDAAARDDFRRVLEGAFERYLDCYRLIAEPGRVGTFGADLTVGGEGGKPRVGKPRTRLRGEAFEACMVQAFEGVTFRAPPSGRAVVVSYSVKFSFSGQ